MIKIAPPNVQFPIYRTLESSSHPYELAYQLLEIVPNFRFVFLRSLLELWRSLLRTIAVSLGIGDKWARLVAILVPDLVSVEAALRTSRCAVITEERPFLTLVPTFECDQGVLTHRDAVPRFNGR